VQEIRNRQRCPEGVGCEYGERPQYRGNTGHR
jgi:hypothetical protein